MMFLTVIVGFVRYLTGTLGTVTNPAALEMLHGLQALSPVPDSEGFRSGTTALTGVEAISNGITAFREPRAATPASP